MNKEIKLLGFNFTKINVERFPEVKGPVSLKSDINIKDISKPTNSIIKQDMLQINFTFSLIFENMGQILMDGGFILGVEEKEAKELLEQWKTKKLDEEKKMFILNLIMQKCSLKALQLEDEFNLPLHIHIPQLTTVPPKSAEKEEKIEKEDKVKASPEKSKSDYIN